MYTPTQSFVQKQATYYPELAAELSGQLGDTEKWEKGRTQYQQLLEQSHDIAEKLESVGIEAYDHNQDLVMFGLHSRQFETLPNFRNINFIPTVARKNRNAQSKDLSMYLQDNRNERMWTITTGKRCNSRELKGRVKKLHRRVSKINSMPFMIHAGASFVYRATEFGEVAPDGDDLSFHPHCHAVLHLEKVLTKKDWAQLLSKIQAYFGTHSQDNGRIQNPRELVKYCVKPSDLEHLSAEQTGILYHASKGLRLCEALQGFRKFRATIRKSNQKVVNRKGIWKLVPNWNQAQTNGKTAPDPELTGDPRSPKLVSWCVPARVFTPVTEPIFIVHGLKTNGIDPSLVYQWPEVRRTEDHINVHTKMLTVQEKGENKYESKSKIYQSGAPPSGVG